MPKWPIKETTTRKVQQKEESKRKSEKSMEKLTSYLCTHPLPLYITPSFIPKVILVRKGVGAVGIRINFPRGECGAEENTVTVYLLYHA